MMIYGHLYEFDEKTNKAVQVYFNLCIFVLNFTN